MMEIQQLSFSYPGQAGPKLLDKLTATVTPGVTFVRGGDGRGKSTLLRLLAGTLTPDAGQIEINGVDAQRQASAYGSQVFWAEPRSEDFDQMTLPDYFQSRQALYPGFDTARLPALTAGLGLEPHLHKQLFMLSTGSKRKVWIAAAFASNAAVTLLDNPFSALDKPSSDFIVQLFSDAQHQKQRVIVFADYEAPEGLSLAATVDLGD